MDWYAGYYGEWSDYHGRYKWQKLNGGHSALSDCLAALDLLRDMASYNEEDEFDSVQKELDEQFELEEQQRREEEEDREEMRKLEAQEAELALEEQKKKDYYVPCPGLDEIPF
jgi:hypothetical protein